MRKARYFVFEPFRLDVIDERLWESERSVHLSHKALAVLICLLSRPGQLVTKDDLLATAWPDTVVGEAVLTTAMRELRRALGDQARIPRFIETVHGRGYRFIAPVTETSLPATTSAATGAVPHFNSSHNLVGREAEWAQLQEWYTLARKGARRIGFVAGEAGIGKTALVEAFVSAAAARGTALVARGQCVQQYGSGEAYLPILEALGRLARDGAPPLVEVLRDYAPSWLAHLPAPLSGESSATPARVTAEKMLRELADALELLTAHDALIFWLEDLHWSDTATLELLDYLARRRAPARLLIVCTYRPGEAPTPALRHLIAELRPHPECPELALDHLSGEAVREYVMQRCGRLPHWQELADMLHRRTGGHPLFLSTILDELLRRRGPESASPQALASVIPASVRLFIEHRFEQLPAAEQSILEAASVAGEPFSVAAVAAACTLPEEQIEAQCAAWAREGQFLAASGTTAWPDGTLAARYDFRHDLFQEVVYVRISPERRARLHRQIGQRLESAYRERAATIAAELAMHFVQGRDARKAVSYLEQAARNALERSAYAEALRHLRRGRELLEALPVGRERLRQELELSLLLGQALMATKGWGSAEIETLYRRGRELCEELGDESKLLPVMWGLIAGSVVRAEYRQTQTLSREVIELARRQGDPVYQVLAHTELGGSTLALGDPVDALRHFREANALYDPRQHATHISCFGMDLGLFSRGWAAHALWQAGFAEQARVQAAATLDCARELSHHFTQTITLAYAAMLHQFRRDVDEVERLAQATISQATEHGFPYYLAWAEVLAGWSLAMRGAGEAGIATIRRSLAVLQTMAGMRLPYYRALLAEACGSNGRIDEALEALAGAFAEIEKTEECCWEAELHRLRGELLRSAALKRHDEAETCFRKALEVARGQQTRSLELRAALSLSRLWRDEGRQDQARRLLAEVHDWFIEGFETPDLKEARALLEELAS